MTYVKFAASHVTETLSDVQTTAGAERPGRATPALSGGAPAPSLGSHITTREIVSQAREAFVRDRMCDPDGGGSAWPVGGAGRHRLAASSGRLPHVAWVAHHDTRNRFPGAGKRLPATGCATQTVVEAHGPWVGRDAIGSPRAAGACPPHLGRTPRRGKAFPPPWQAFARDRMCDPDGGGSASPMGGARPRAAGRLLHPGRGHQSRTSGRAAGTSAGRTPRRCARGRECATPVARAAQCARRPRRAPPP